jgi:hypothetical protein
VEGSSGRIEANPSGGPSGHSGCHGHDAPTGIEGPHAQSREVPTKISQLGEVRQTGRKRTPGE